MIKVNIRGHEIYLTDEIRDYASNKLNKLCKKYKTIIDVDLMLEENHNKMEATAAVASATIHIPGKDISGLANGRTIYAAIDELEKKLARQLAKDKELHHSNTNGKFANSKAIIRKIFRQS